MYQQKQYSNLRFCFLSGSRERDVLESYSRDMLLRRYRELQRYLSEVEQERERDRLRDRERDSERDSGRDTTRDQERERGREGGRERERDRERERERWEKLKLMDADSVSINIL